MKTVRVTYKCNECGATSTAYDAERGRWARVFYGGLSQGKDMRHACSYKCAIAIMKDMQQNLAENE